MDLRTKIENHILQDELSKAIERLRSEDINFNQKADLLIVEKDLNKLQRNERIGAITDETARVEQTRISQAIIALTDYIINGEPEEKKSFKSTEFIEQIPSQHLIGFLIFLEISIGILGELMPDTIKTSIEAAVGKENYPTFYIITLIATIALFVWLSVRKKQPKKTTKPLHQFAGERANIHASLLERYTHRLKQKIDYRLPIDLKLTYTKEGASPEYAHFASGLREGRKLEEDLVSTLKKYQHLLIIGNPGAGKTTQILELAKAWLEDNKNTQLPVIFNLAAWRGDYQHFYDWLQSALVSGYGFSPSLAKEAIENNEILPLLDGLDEIGKDLPSDEEQSKLRSKCLDAIDRYIALSNVPHLVICSRINEYKTTTDAPIQS